LTEKTNLIITDTQDELKRGLQTARKILLSGGAVAFPTESFYGLGVNASDEDAIKHLFILKRRGSDRPVLVLIPCPEYLEGYVDCIPETASELIKRFWPGGLTLVFKAGPEISPLLTAGTGKIGIRVSSHPIAAGLTRTTGLPITGTSANISSQDGCLTAQEVYESLGSGVDLILDGGKTGGGKGSTILDVTVEPPVILREGMVGREQLQDFIPLSDVRQG
jgi:L-threonylcarbamoyladenylate synthase